MFDDIGPITVVIPARAGSKRLLKKNIKIIADKPLIEWTVDVALSCFDKQSILVSTDDSEIISIAKSKGLRVPAKRPSYLCADDTTTQAVVLYELNKAKKYNGVVLILQPTSPLRTKEDIQNSINTYKKYNATGVVSVCECDHPPEWINTLSDDLSMENFLKIDQDRRSQDLSKSYRLNGAIYLFDIFKYRQIKNIINDKNTFAYIMDKRSSIDIDDDLDFQIAEMILVSRNE